MDSDEVEKINLMLERDVELREKIKEHVNEFDKRTRTMVGMLNKIHTTPSDANRLEIAVPALLDSARTVLLSCRETTHALSVTVPENQFWRWKDMWSNPIRTAVFAATLIEYLSGRTLLSLPQAANMIGIKEEWSDRVNLPVEDYLHGLISLVNELSRLAVNAVTLGNFDEPIKISIFVKELFVGFSMLNLKNDTLRRRYDSLKYDIKKIEEVVYDVSLRKLTVGSQHRPLAPAS
ncbi:Translin [Crassisporium funariophilum]|nr:Translin [Crassisporium funariophilum]